MPRRVRARSAIGKLEIVIILAVIGTAIIGVVGYYSPVTNPPTFSQTFRYSINCSCGWKEFDAVYYTIGWPPVGAANYSEGTELGYGPAIGGTITTSGPVNPGWTLCIVGEKLDSSNVTLAVGLDGFTNETSLPYGHAMVCELANH